MFLGVAMNKKEILSLIGGICGLAIVPYTFVILYIFADDLRTWRGLFGFATIFVFAGIAKICFKIVERIEADEKENDFPECKKFFETKHLEATKIAQILNNNDLVLLYNKYPQKYYDFQIIKGETFACFDKLKNYTDKSDECCSLCKNMANKLKELKEFVSIAKINIENHNNQTTSQTYSNYTSPRYEPPQPQLSRNERLLKEYEEKQYLKAEEIGRRYERYIGYLCEIDGYKVDYNGIKKGVKDGGVDLICSKRKELVIIQCKCRDDQGQIHENTILQLVANLMKYKRKYPNKNVSAVIYTSHDNLDDEAKATLADEVAHGALIHHIIKAYDNSYPKVKCNISDNGEKIYHIPDHSSTYDRIQIEINKGEFFAKTIKEAESAGFRASKA